MCRSAPRSFLPPAPAQGMRAVTPPSATMVVAVMCDAASETRKSATCAISSLLPSLPCGPISSRCASCSFVQQPRNIGVAMWPGAMQFTRIFLAADSMAATRDMLMMPPLLAA